MTKENDYRATIDEKIRYYAIRYKNGKATTEEIKILVRLLYEEKNERKKAVWILNQCMGQTEDTALQLLYLYEALRVFRFFHDAIYEKYETALYQKLKQLAEKEVVHSYAVLSILYSCMEDALRRKDFTCYHSLEQIWKSSWKNNMVWKKRFRALKKEVKNSKIKGIFAGFIVACILVALVMCITVPTISTYFRNQKEAVYLESHNMLLTPKELSKMKKLEQKYEKRSEYVIRYCQLAQDEKAEPIDTEKYICLLVKNYGTIVTYELQCKGAEEELQKTLWSSILEVLKGEAEDFEKCRQYFQLAYKMMNGE